MKSIAAIVTGLTLASTGLVVPALAGGPTDVPPEPMIAPPAPAPVALSDWQGFYAGAQLGYGDVSAPGEATDGSGFLGGLHAGYRWDFGQFIAGAEIEHDRADIDLGAASGDSLDDVTRLKLIGGADLGRSMVYGTVGAAHAGATVGGTGRSDDGWFMGAGMAVALTERWSIGGEVLQHRFDDFDGTGVDLEATTLSARVSLRF